MRGNHPGTPSMGQKMKLIKSISRVESQKMGLVSLAGCFLISLGLLIASWPYGPSLSTLNLWVKDVTPTSHMAAEMRSSIQSGNRNGIQQRKPICDWESGLCETSADLSLPNNSSTAVVASTQRQQDRSDSKQTGPRIQSVKPETKPVCDFSNPRTNICEMDGDIRIHGNSSSIFFITSTQEINESYRIKPHPRKGDVTAMSQVTEVSVISSANTQETPRCTINHTVPAIVFSTGGYMGNAFHDFTDVLIPLFITSRQYQGEVQFLVTNILPKWNLKYKPLLQQLSRYEIIDFNMEKQVHCYPHVIVGLRSHKVMTIDPSRSPNGYSMLDFGQLMRSSFTVERETAIKLGADQNKKPRLLIIPRTWTRALKNVDEIARMAEGLGYEVVVKEPKPGSDLTEFAHLVNSCDVVMGVHGAGLTNLVFLPINAIVIQIVPLGNLEGISYGCFGVPSLDLKLRYLQYSISVEESTLIEVYPRDHPVFKDPLSIHKKGWLAVRDAYLVKQNVKLDVGRFKGVLLQALELLKL